MERRTGARATSCCCLSCSNSLINVNNTKDRKKQREKRKRIKMSEIQWFSYLRAQSDAFTVFLGPNLYLHFILFFVLSRFPVFSSIHLFFYHAFFLTFVVVFFSLDIPSSTLFTAFISLALFCYKELTLSLFIFFVVIIITTITIITVIFVIIIIIINST